MEIHIMAYRETERVVARKEDKRRRIIVAARGLIAEGGFAAVQMSAVAAVAGIATGTVYRYFPSKSELVADVFRVVTQWEVDVMGQVARGEGNAAERLEAAIATFSKRALIAQRLAYALIFEPIDPIVDAERMVFRRSYATIISGLLEEGMAAGIFPSQSQEIVANCIVGAMAEALVGPLATDNPHSSSGEQAIETIVDFCLKAVGYHTTP
jgi:AcrR family transcriptional regulator